MKLEKGMLIRTNYSGPYRILKIIRGCTCPSYLDTTNKDNPPHIHLTVTRPDGSRKCWLNYFVEETLLSLHKTYCGYKTEIDYDRIIVMKSDVPIQFTLW